MSKSIIDKIFNIFSGKKLYGCPYVYYSLFFDFQNNIRVCPKKDNGILIRNFDGIWLDTAKIEQEKKAYVNKFKSGCMDAICSNCEYLQYGNFEEQKELKEIRLGHWKNCYLRCKYCSSEKNADLLAAKHYNIFDTINRLIDEKMLTVDTKIIFECGDAAIHPEFDKLLYFFMNYESNDIIVNTPALTYRESIADAIAKNAIKLIVNIDCANKQIYKYIKGENSFDIAAANMRRYLQYQEPDEKRVITKYTLYKGGNDGKKEISDWFVMSRDIGVNEILVDIDENWFEELKNEIPDYLKEIFFFVKKISNLGSVTLDFSPRAQKIYNLAANKK